MPNLQLNKVSLGDYSWYSLGNLQRVSNSLDRIQQQAGKLDRSIASPLGTRNVLGTPVIIRVVDTAQYSAWELRLFGSKAATTVLDQWLLDGLEDAAERVLNSGWAEPRETQPRPAPAAKSTRRK